MEGWKGVDVHALGCHAIFGEIMGVVADAFVVLIVLKMYTNITEERFFFHGTEFY